jgi:hypothetical protein
MSISVEDVVAPPVVVGDGFSFGDSGLEGMECLDGHFFLAPPQPPWP